MRRSEAIRAAHTLAAESILDVHVWQHLDALGGEGFYTANDHHLREIRREFPTKVRMVTTVKGQK